MSLRLTRLQGAEAHYAVTAQTILNLTQHAAQLFELAEVNVQKPFDLLIASP